MNNCILPHALDDLLELIHKVSDAPEKTELVVSGADHGVAKEKISRYQFGQTLSILKISASSHSPVSRACRKIGIRSSFLNVGCFERRCHRSINDLHHFGAGTKNIGEEAAMETSVLNKILESSERFVKTSPSQQFCLGEVGIGNTLASSALVAVLCNKSVQEVTGRGTGIAEDVFVKKVSLVERAITRHLRQAEVTDPLDVLTSLGGFEIAWNVGIILAAHKYNKLVLLDGFITGTAALIAVSHNPHVVSHLVATHLSREPGHQHLLSTLGLRPFLNLNMALGQGFGAVLGFSFLLNTASFLRKQ